MSGADRHTGSTTITLRLAPGAVADLEAAAAAEGKTRHAFLVGLVELARDAWRERLAEEAAEPHRGGSLAELDQWRRGRLAELDRG